MNEEQKLNEKEEKLKKKLEQLETMERAIREKEKAVKQKEKAKKQIVLRLAPSLWEEIQRWAEEDSVPSTDRSNTCSPNVSAGEKNVDTPPYRVIIRMFRGKITEKKKR